jgi:hypothetical protein
MDAGTPERWNNEAICRAKVLSVAGLHIRVTRPAQSLMVSRPRVRAGSRCSPTTQVLTSSPRGVTMQAALSDGASAVSIATPRGGQETRNLFAPGIVVRPQPHWPVPNLAVRLIHVFLRLARRPVLFVPVESPCSLAPQQTGRCAAMTDGR